MTKARSALLMKRATTTLMRASLVRDEIVKVERLDGLNVRSDKL